MQNFPSNLDKHPSPENQELITHHRAINLRYARLAYFTSIIINPLLHTPTTSSMGQGGKIYGNLNLVQPCLWSTTKLSGNEEMSHSMNTEVS